MLQNQTITLGDLRDRSVAATLVYVRELTPSDFHSENRFINAVTSSDENALSNDALGQFRLRFELVASETVGAGHMMAFRYRPGTERAGQIIVVHDGFNLERLRNGDLSTLPDIGALADLRSPAEHQNGAYRSQVEAYGNFARRVHAQYAHGNAVHAAP